MKTFSLFRPMLHAVIAAAMLVLATLSGPASATEVKLILSGDMEVPAVATKASGSGTITFNKDRTVSGSIATSEIIATAAHIHLGKTGTNGPVIITLERDGDNGWKVPDGAKLDEAQYRAYMGGELYINVHSAAHKGGEIRGQLIPAPTTLGGK